MRTVLVGLMLMGILALRGQDTLRVELDTAITQEITDLLTKVAEAEAEMARHRKSLEVIIKAIGAGRGQVVGFGPGFVSAFIKPD